MSDDQCTCDRTEIQAMWPMRSLGSRRETYEQVCPIHSPAGHKLMTPYDAAWPSTCECGDFTGYPYQHLDHVAHVLATTHDQEDHQ